MNNNHNDSVFLDSLFSIVRELIVKDDNEEQPCVIKYTYLRLIKENENKEEVIESIVSVLISEMYFSLKSEKHDLFEDRFNNHLDDLPETPILD